MLAVLYKIQERNDTFFKQAGVQVYALLIFALICVHITKTVSSKAIKICYSLDKAISRASLYTSHIKYVSKENYAT